MTKEILSFGYGEIDEYDPTHNDVDWKTKFAGEVALAGMEIPPPVWVESTQGLKAQLHQENYYIWINETSDELDCLQVLDERDGGVWTFFRDDLPEGEFDRLLNASAHASSFVHTLYPPKAVQDLYEQQADLADFEIPAEWETSE